MTASLISGRAYAYGLAKQTVVGTPNPPSSSVGMWIPWENGAQLGPDMDTEQYYVGDGTAGQAGNIKKRQNGIATYTMYAQPKHAAQCLEAISGAGSDVVGTQNGTTGVYPHTITPSLTVPNLEFFTLLKAINASTQYAIQVQDAILTKLTISADISNPIVKFEAEFLGVSTKETTYPTTAFFADGYMNYLSGSANWVTPVAAITSAVKGFTLVIDRNVDVTKMQGNSINILPPIPGNLTVSGTLNLLWQSGDLNAFAYYNAAASTGSLTDAVPIPTGELQMKFTDDNDSNQSLQLTIPAMSIGKLPPEQPDVMGAPVEQTVDYYGLRYSNPIGGGGAAVNPYQAIVNCKSSTAF